MEYKTIRGKRSLKSLDYLAGFFDGEGSIFIAKINNKKSGNIWYRLNVSCGNSDKRPINMLRQFNPNYKLITYISGRKKTYKPAYQWLITGNMALNFLKTIKDKLIVKKKQAEVGIKFQEWRNTLPNTGKSRTVKILARCEIYRQKIKNLNLMNSQPQRLSEETPKGDATV